MKNVEIITKIFRMKTIAVVGFSSKKHRPSYFVSLYMKQNGYNIIPVNPNHKIIDDMKCYPDLQSIKVTIDIVNIFRRSEYVPEIVESAISIKAKAIWMQDDVINENAEKIAKEAGLLVIMNDCMLRRHQFIN